VNTRYSSKLTLKVHNHQLPPLTHPPAPSSLLPKVYRSLEYSPQMMPRPSQVESQRAPHHRRRAACCAEGERKRRLAQEHKDAIYAKQLQRQEIQFVQPSGKKRKVAQTTKKTKKCTVVSRHEKLNSQSNPCTLGRTLCPCIQRVVLLLSARTFPRQRISTCRNLQ
jgi:hypothetical protein